MYNGKQRKESEKCGSFAVGIAIFNNSITNTSSGQTSTSPLI